MNPNRCKHCGAPARVMRSYCDYCGTPYAHQEAAAPPQPDVPEAQRVAEGPLAALLAHPDTARFLEQGPRRPVPTERREGRSPMRLVLLAVALFFFISNAPRLRLGHPGTVLPAGMLALIAVAHKRSRDRATAFPGSPLEALPARIEEVTQPWNRTADPRPRVVLQLTDGRRRYLRLNRELVGELAPRDLGVAFLKADVMVDFRIVRL
ncbi:MAG: hypothetical protein R3F17_15240 [Planctomycetota bacterium]